VRVPLYALAGVMRSGATRSNYHSSKVFVALAGVHYATARAVATELILDDSLAITDVNGQEPSRATFRAKGFTLTGGTDVVITLGSQNNLDRIFAGTVLPTTQSYVGTPANRVFSASCIDYTWGLQALLVTGRWYTTVAAIAAELIATYAPGYTCVVETGFADIDEFTATNEPLPAVLARLVKRGSATGDWKCDYHKVVRLFPTADTSGTAPTVLNTVQPITAQGGHSLESFAVARDPSPWITRVYVEAGGGDAFAAVAAGETILPVTNAEWYQETGGTVKSGPQGPTHITYTGRDLGGGGGLVGTGAAPSSPPVATLAGGAGVTDGAHLIAITFVTAAGESLPGPTAAITVGVVAAPTDAPAAGTPTIGTGPNAGSHDYAVTFVTSSGETTAGASVTKATGLTTAPASAPTPGTPTSGSGVDDGPHDYAITYVTSIGETTPSPISGQVTTSTTGAYTISAPSGSGSAANSTDPTNSTSVFAVGDAVYVVETYLGGAGETTPGAASNTVVAIASNHPTQPRHILVTGLPVSSDGNVTSKRVYVNVNGSWIGYYGLANSTTGQTVAVSVTAGSPPGANTATVAAAARQQVPLTAIPVPSDANITSKNLYRRSGGAGLKLVTSLAVATTTYTDTTANASLGAAAPATNTAYLQRIPLTAIPTGGALVTQRKIYRTAAGGAQLKLVTTLADNTTTTYTDTVTDASLGANVPVANTATANQIALTGIPIGFATLVTSRNVYMSAAGAAQLKFVATIADNTTSTYTITMADGSLGANVPTSDASGLAQPAGQTLAGSTALVVAGTGAFKTGGGWAVIGNGTQVIRYTGKTGSQLTGIPASGPGAIVASIGYNSTVTAAPALTGIPASGAGSIAFAILKGDPVNLWVTVDDLVGQAAYATRFGGAGIKEAVLQDRRLALTEATALGTAYVATHGAEDVTITYLVRDQNTRAGRQVPINLGAPTSVTDDFVIQTVTITNFASARHPDFLATAAAARVSLDDVYQRR